MQKSLIILFGLVLMGLLGLVILRGKVPEQIGCTMEARVCPDGSSVGRSGPRCEFAPCPEGGEMPQPQGGEEPEEQVKSEVVLPHQQESAFISPLLRAGERVTKKPFGMVITPETSPVQPERFWGYHAGTDFETFEEEAEADVVVRAICSGPVLLKQRASGYGGVVVQRCFRGQEPMTIIYGHLRLKSVEKVVGEELFAGEALGLLGTGESQETDGERKHLHVGIRSGSEVDIRGYVVSKPELEEWIDPCRLFSCVR